MVSSFRATATMATIAGLPAATSLSLTNGRFHRLAGNPLLE
jgi:hypothetical protein